MAVPTYAPPAGPASRPGVGGRVLRGALAGAALGAAVAAVLLLAARRDANPAAAGFGTAWLLWALGLPWSELVRAGAPDAAPAALVYGAMPAVAWGVWGALVGWWRARRAARRAARGVGRGLPA